jgi:hypothetical protein
MECRSAPGPGKIILLCFFLLAAFSAAGQDILERKISVSVSNQPISEVLKLISVKANFYFVYNSHIINRDSLVSFSATNRSVRQILDQLFNGSIDFRQKNNYIIFRKAAPKIITGTRSGETDYIITGYVLNAETGEKIQDASIYGKQRLVSTLTDGQGYFTIRLKNRYGPATLVASKSTYKDTFVNIEPNYNQQVTFVMEPVLFKYSTVTVSPDYSIPDSISAAPDTISYIPVVNKEVKEVENTGVGRFLLSAKQRIQSLNLGKFFADRLVQFSLIPGVSTNGKLSGQVVNNFSFNVLGGYTGGAEGVELGGLFNINKNRMRGLQVAGLFNIAGGPAYGVQLAGIHNTVLDPVTGLQASGISNYVKGAMVGWQVAGIHNHVADSVTGAQIGGITNYAKGNVKGAQIGGIANFANRNMSGLQVAGIFNYAKKLKGVQIGLINISDSSSGFSIGLINFVVKGYHKIAFSTNESMNMNLALKGGNSKLYSILLASMNSRQNEKAYSYGYGLGTEINFGKWFSLNPELTAQHVYLGSFDYGNIMGKMHLQFNLRPGKYFTLFAGPSFTAFYSDQTEQVDGYKSKFPSEGYHTFKLWDNKTTGWIGWNAGIAFF